MQDKNSQPVDISIEHERLMTILNNMGDGVIAIDASLRVDLFNSSALSILNINNINKKTYITDIFKPVNQYNQQINLEKIIRSATTTYSSRQYKLKQDDNHNAAIFFSVTPVKPGYGSNVPGGYVIILRDITSEIQLEEEKNEFISVISHELRTPITIAEGSISNAEFMSGKYSSHDSVKKAIAESHKHINYLSALINDLSMLNRAETKKLNVEISKINVNNLLNDLLKQYKAQAEYKNLNLTAEIDPTLELLSSSELYVKEILQNLISNAMKYTDKGYIDVKAMKSNTGVVFEVRDSGIGISSEDQGAIFDKFFRSADYHTSKTGGTGLGLYITLKLVKLIKAEIDVKSELGKGSIFKVTIPNLGS